MDTIFYIYFALNLITFLLIGYDKHQEHYGQWRFPSWLVMVLTILFGGFGALCGMILFNHLGKDKTLRILIPMMACVQVAVLVVLKVFVF